MKALYRIAAAGLLLCLLSCLSWWIEKPAFRLQEVVVDHISAGDLRMTLKVEAENPNRFDLTITSLDYTFTIDRHQVGKGSLTTEVRLPASAKSIVDIPLSVRLGPAGGLLKSIFSGRESVYGIEGTARIHTLIGSTTVPFSATGTFRPKRPRSP